MASSGLLWKELLRLDGAMGVVVNAEKQVFAPVVVADNVARQLGRLIEQTVFGSGNEEARHLDGEPVKPGFTRQAGAFRRHGEWGTGE